MLTCIDRNESRFYRIYHRSLRELNLLRKISKNEQMNLTTPTKQTTVRKSNPSNLMAGRVPSEVLEARIKAFNEQSPETL